MFNVPPDKIEVVVHRESILHSAVQYSDSSIIAQLGLPDMHIPIQYALTYPERSPSPAKQLDLAEIGKLSFYKPDYDTFTCLLACLDAIRRGGLKPAAANGANEQAVELFLKGKIGFLKIGELVLDAVSNQPDQAGFTLEDVFAADTAARERAKSLCET